MVAGDTQFKLEQHHQLSSLGKTENHFLPERWKVVFFWPEPGVT